MKLCILVDNAPGVQDGLIAEHGFSMWLNINGEQWLIDTGESDAFLTNASQLGIDIAEVDYLVLSHGHRDHCGGLETFLSLNDKAKIYLSTNINNNHYYSTRRGIKCKISLNHSLIEKQSHRFIFVDNDIKLNEHIVLISSFSSIHPKPLANNTLLANDSPDDFNHEIVVAINSSNGIIIVSPCSHNGVLNTLDACSHLGNITHYIGGTHLIDDFESEKELLSLATTIKQRYPNLTLISGHCTGNCAKKIFREALNDKFIEFYTGFSSNID